MGKLQTVLKVTRQQYTTLINNGTITVGGKTYRYSTNTLYLIEEDNIINHSLTIKSSSDNAIYLNLNQYDANITIGNNNDVYNIFINTNYISFYDEPGDEQLEIHSYGFEYSPDLGDSWGTFTWPYTSGTLAVDSNGITKNSNQTVRLYEFNPHLYQLTYNGTKNIYYYQNNTSTYVSVTGKNLFAYQLNWYYLFFNAPSNGGFPYLYNGVKSSSTYYTKKFDSIITAHKTRYMHVISAFIRQKDAQCGVGFSFSILTDSGASLTIDKLFSFINGHTDLYIPIHGLANNIDDGQFAYIVHGLRAGGLSSSLYISMTDFWDPSTGGLLNVYKTASVAGSTDWYFTSFTDRVSTY